jgi:riboflavin kinase/FMN adenylyltransferase
MKVIRGIENFEKFKNPVVTLGTYDGVHLGHQQLLNKMKKIAEDLDGKTMVITFWPHPRYVLKKDEDKLQLLTTLDDKALLLEHFGIDYLLILNFTKEFSRQNPNEFIKNLMVDTVDAKSIVIGYDHRFGKDRSGSNDFLKEESNNHGFDVHRVDEFNVNDISVSSTKIRQLMDNNQIEEANILLGYEFFIQGKVVKGLGLGKKLEFPTANVEVNDPNKHIPSDGIYVVQVEVEGKKYFGMLNSGYNPTIEGKGRSIEVHIFDFGKDIYGKNVRISFLHRLRDEMKFNNTGELTKQMYRDKEHSFEFLKTFKPAF